MKKFVDLVKNESLKLWGQKSFRVLLIILAVILVLTPSLNAAFVSSLSNTAYDEPDPENYKQRAEDARAEGDELKAREYEVYYETELYFAEGGYYRSSVEYSLYYHSYLELAMARSSLRLISEGEYTVDMLNGSYYSSLDELYAFLTDFGFYDDMGENGYMQYNVLTIVNQALADRSAEEWIKSVESELASVCFNIENFSMRSYYGQLKTFAQERISELKASREESLKTFKNSNLPNEETDYHRALIDYFTDVIACYEAYEKGVDYLIVNDCEYSSWEYNTAAGILYEVASSAEYYVPLHRDDFSSGHYSYQYSDVEEYNEDMQNERLLALEARDYSIYSLENSIPMPVTLTETSTKATTVSQFRTFAGVLAVLFICYGGIMMAHEYSSGTIRLLLIKPRTRRRILCSKLVCLVFWWVVLATGAMLLLTLENMLMLGVGDVFVPDLKATGKGIAEIPSFVSALGVFGEELVIAMLYVAFAILFAILTKKTALAVVFPMLVSMGASTIQTVCIALYDVGATFLAYTPFFYLDFEFLHVTAPECFAYDYSGSLLATVYATTNTVLGKHANIWIGIAMIAALTVLVALWALRAFKKQKI